MAVAPAPSSAPTASQPLPDPQRESPEPVAPSEGGSDAAVPGTPEAFIRMITAVETAAQGATEAATPGTRPQVGQDLDHWLSSAGLEGALATPARSDLRRVWAAAAEAQQLRRQMDALREAELDMAAREASETARNLGLLEEENLALAATNMELQDVLARREEVTLAAAAQRALRQADQARRLSDVYLAEQVESFRALDAAEQQLAGVQGGKDSGATMTPQQLHAAQATVAAAAGAAQAASERLRQVEEEKERLQAELAALQQRLEQAPDGSAIASLRERVLEMQGALREEKAAHTRVTAALVEHAERLSRECSHLSGRCDWLHDRYARMRSHNRELEAQLMAAHEAIYDMQTMAASTPPARRRQLDGMEAELRAARQAVVRLEAHKAELELRLMQAQGAVLDQRPALPPASPPPRSAFAAAAEAETTPEPLHQRARHGGATPASPPGDDGVSPPQPLSPLLATALADPAATPHERRRAATDELSLLQDQQVALQAGIASAASALAGLSTRFGQGRGADGHAREVSEDVCSGQAAAPREQGGDCQSAVRAGLAAVCLAPRREVAPATDTTRPDWQAGDGMAGASVRGACEGVPAAVSAMCASARDGGDWEVSLAEGVAAASAGTLSYSGSNLCLLGTPAAKETAATEAEAPLPRSMAPPPTAATAASGTLAAGAAAHRLPSLSPLDSAGTVSVSEDVDWAGLVGLLAEYGTPASPAVPPVEQPNWASVIGLLSGTPPPMKSLSPASAPQPRCSAIASDDSARGSSSGSAGSDVGSVRRSPTTPGASSSGSAGVGAAGALAAGAVRVRVPMDSPQALRSAAERGLRPRRGEDSAPDMLSAVKLPAPGAAGFVGPLARTAEPAAAYAALRTSVGGGDVASSLAWVPTPEVSRVGHSSDSAEAEAVVRHATHSRVASVGSGGGGGAADNDAGDTATGGVGGAPSCAADDAGSNHSTGGPDGVGGDADAPGPQLPPTSPIAAACGSPPGLLGGVDSPSRAARLPHGLAHCSSPYAEFEQLRRRAAVRAAAGGVASALQALLAQNGGEAPAQQVGAVDSADEGSDWWAGATLRRRSSSAGDPESLARPDCPTPGSACFLALGVGSPASLEATATGLLRCASDVCRSGGGPEAAAAAHKAAPSATQLTDALARSMSDAGKARVAGGVGAAVTTSQPSRFAAARSGQAVAPVQRVDVATPGAALDAASCSFLVLPHEQRSVFGWGGAVSEGQARTAADSGGGPPPPQGQAVDDVSSGAVCMPHGPTAAAALPSVGTHTPAQSGGASAAADDGGAEPKQAGGQVDSAPARGATPSKLAAAGDVRPTPARAAVVHIALGDSPEQPGAPSPGDTAWGPFQGAAVNGAPSSCPVGVGGAAGPLRSGGSPAARRAPERVRVPSPPPARLLDVTAPGLLLPGGVIALGSSPNAADASPLEQHPSPGGDSPCAATPISYIVSAVARLDAGGGEGEAAATPGLSTGPSISTVLRAAARATDSAAAVIAAAQAGGAAAGLCGDRDFAELGACDAAAQAGDGAPLPPTAPQPASPQPSAATASSGGVWATPMAGNTPSAWLPASAYHSAFEGCASSKPAAGGGRARPESPDAAQPQAMRSAAACARERSAAAHHAISPPAAPAAAASAAGTPPTRECALRSPPAGGGMRLETMFACVPATPPASTNTVATPDPALLKMFGISTPTGSISFGVGEEDDDGAGAAADGAADDGATMPGGARPRVGGVQLRTHPLVLSPGASSMGSFGSAAWRGEVKGSVVVDSDAGSAAKRGEAVQGLPRGVTGGSSASEVEALMAAAVKLSAANAGAQLMRASLQLATGAQPHEPASGAVAVSADQLAAHATQTTPQPTSRDGAHSAVGKQASHEDKQTQVTPSIAAVAAATGEGLLGHRG